MLWSRRQRGDSDRRKPDAGCAVERDLARRDFAARCGVGGRSPRTHRCRARHGCFADSLRHRPHHQHAHGGRPTSCVAGAGPRSALVHARRLWRRGAAARSNAGAQRGHPDRARAALSGPELRARHVADQRATFLSQVGDRVARSYRDRACQRAVRSARGAGHAGGDRGRLFTG